MQLFFWCSDKAINDSFQVSLGMTFPSQLFNCTALIKLVAWPILSLSILMKGIAYICWLSLFDDSISLEVM